MTVVVAAVQERVPAPSAPVWPRIAEIVVALAAGIGLFACTRLSTQALIEGTGAVQAVLVVSWVVSTGLPGRVGALLLGLGCAGTADLLVLAFPHGRIGALAPALGPAVLVMFAHQLVRGVVRTRVVESLSDIAMLVVAVVALPAFVQLRHEFRDGAIANRITGAMVGAATLAVVVGGVIDLVRAQPRFDPAVPRGGLAVLGAVLAGAAAGWVRLHTGAGVEFTAQRGALAGAAVGGITALLAVGATFVGHGSAVPQTGWGPRFRPGIVGLLPLCLIAPIAYVLCLAIRG